MRKVNKSCFSRHSISMSEELCVFLLKWTKNHPPCTPGTENILQRVISTLKLLWAFVLSLLDDLTDGLNSFCKDNLDISKVLRFERALLNQQQKKVRETVLEIPKASCLYIEL